jgi:hypothetical protein
LRRRHEADDPTAWIRTLDFTPFGERPRIMIAHGSTTVFASGGTSQADDEEPPTGGINTVAIDRLPLDELDYLALGDWHGFLAAGPKTFYSGAPEIDRFPKPGQRPGHVAVVAAARGDQPRVEPVPTGRFRWLVHAVDLGDDGPRQLDEWLAEAARPTAAGEAGFDAALARLEVTGSVSLTQRAELDRIVESWTARLLRLDLDDQTVLAPSADEIRELAERPGDPIIARVATELVALLDGTAAAAGTAPAAEPDVIRRGLHILYALVTTADAEPAEALPPAGDSRTAAEPATACPAAAENAAP